jgi:hypothetical protein
MKTLFKIKWIIVISLLVCSTRNIQAQTNFIWGKQFGSDKGEVAFNPVTDQNGNVYIAGNTSGTLSEKSFGKSDGFITKLDSIGNIIWTKQLGSTEDDGINWITIDKKGNLYVSGYTKGVFNDKNFGREDIIVAKLDNAGNVEWQKQYGSDSSEVANDIFVDDQGSIYISGVTKGLLGKKAFGKADCFILKLDNKGNQLFTSQFGTLQDDMCNGITVDNSYNIYVCGITFGDLGAKNKGKNDVIAGKFNSQGEQIKIIQFGTDNYEGASKILIDKEKNIYIGGSTGGDLATKQKGEGDAILTKLNENLDILWTQQFGTPKWDGILGMVLDDKLPDNVLVSGCQNWPSCESYIRMYKKDGTLVWVKQFVANGKNGGTCGKGVCIDYKGNLYHTGTTGANLFGTNQGDHDVFVIKQELDKVQ